MGRDRIDVLLGTLEMLSLQILSRAPQLHGYDIIERLRERSGGAPGRRRRPLSRAPSTRVEGVTGRRVAPLTKQPSRQVLPPDRTRPTTARTAETRMAARGRRHGTGAWSRL